MAARELAPWALLFFACGAHGIHSRVPRRFFVDAVASASTAALLGPRAARANGLVLFPPESLQNRYFLLRAGETVAEAAGRVETNPIATLGPSSYLTNNGVAQVEEAAKALLVSGLDGGTGCWVYYNKASPSQQTAAVLQWTLGISNSNMIPDFAWLDPRGVGALEGRGLGLWSDLHSMDAGNPLYRPPPGEDGTLSESAADLLVRVRNLISILETSYQGADVVLVSPSSDVLSVLMAAAKGEDLRAHAKFALEPAQFAVLDLRTYRPEETAIVEADAPAGASI
jgi:broad specificity phosphatase PhoE